MKKHDDALFLTVAQFARAVQLNPHTVYKAIKNKKIKAAVKIAGELRIPRAYLDGFLEQAKAEVKP